MKTIAPFFSFRADRIATILSVVIFGFLWFVLINHLRVEWTVNPQYGYGWVVLFLCAYLIWEKAKNRKQKAEGENVFICHPPSAIVCLLPALCALLYAPTRLVEEANPEWRLVSWALAVEVVGLTLGMIALAGGGGQMASAETLKTEARKVQCRWQKANFRISKFQLSAFTFPICFFLVAVPWPSALESSVIQGLTRADAALTCELLGWLNIPAIPHGNVIEVATGQVGINEACSGIRSFQATLMISLFLGELHRLNWCRRLGLVLAGFIMSFGFNLARMSVLVCVAAHKGTDAIARWHDPTGVTILLACFFGLWALGTALGKKQKAESEKQKVETPDSESHPSSACQAFLVTPKPVVGGSFSVFQISAFALCLWLLMVEVSVAAWYGWHEARLPAAVQWTVTWPADNPSCQPVKISETARQILRYDEGRSATWSADGLAWQVIFLRWNPGSTALHLAQNHTPEVCLTAAGHLLKPFPELQWLEVRGLHLPFRVYEVTDTPRPLFVFYCLWDDRASTRDFDTMSLNYSSRLAPVRQGLRNPGQRSIEMAVSGADDAAAAERAMRAELEKIVAVTPL